jgi:hypothetical protein
MMDEEARGSEEDNVLYKACAAKAERRRQSWGILLANRLLACLLSIAALWITSLSTAGYITSLVVCVPSAVILEEAILSAVSAAKEQKREYEECVQRQSNFCSSDLDAFEREKRQYLTEVREHNAHQLTEANRYTEGCNAALTEIQEALRGWTELEQPLAENCSSDQGSLNMDMIVGAAAAAQQRQEIISAYSVEASVGASATTLVMSRMAQYARDRVAYDEEYASKKAAALAVIEADLPIAIMLPIELAVDELEAEWLAMLTSLDTMASCTTMRSKTASPNVCNLADSARELLESARVSLLAQLGRARDGFSAYADAFAVYKAQVQGAYANMVTYYQASQNLLDAIFRDTRILSLLSALGIQIGAWASMDLADFQAFNVPAPDATGILESVPDLPLTMDQVWNQVSLAYTQAFLAVDGMWDGVSSLPDSVRAAIHAELNLQLSLLSLDDYNPPKYCASGDEEECIGDDEAEHESAVQELTDGGHRALDAMASLPFSASAELYAGIEPVDVLFDFSLPSYRFSSVPDFDLESLSPEGLEFGKIFGPFAALWALLVFSDVALRSLRSLRIAAKFWSRGGVDVPPADLRTDRRWKNIYGAWAKFQRTAWSVLIHPVTTTAVGAILATFFAYQAVVLYLPVYNKYRDTCVSPAETAGFQNGTFITQNLYTLAYNYAAQDGSKKQLELLSDYDSSRSGLCTNLTTGFQNSQAESSLALTYMKQSLQRSQGSMALLGDCVNITELSFSFQEACCGLNGYTDCSEAHESRYSCPIRDSGGADNGVPFVPPDMLLNSPLCKADPSQWVLLGGRGVDCNDMPDCDITCRGPDKKLLWYSTTHAGCAVEWALHAGWLNFALTLIIFMLMNLARALFVQGMIKLSW